MRGSRGPTQVEEKNLAEPSPSDLAEGSSDAMSIPICFLVKEQAKSVVAIQELQKRVQQIEDVQGDVMSAISDVHDCLSVSTNRECAFPSTFLPNKTPRCNESSFADISSDKVSTTELLESDIVKPCSFKNASTGKGSTKLSQSFGKNLVESERFGQILEEKCTGSMRTKDSAPESDKQDSGLDSGCREVGQESNITQCELAYICAGSARRNNQKDSDELLDLLDEIGEKSEMLKQHVTSATDGNIPSPQVTPEVKQLQVEQLDLHNLLCSLKGERDNLKDKLVNLASTTSELAAQKQTLEQRFMSVLLEKNKLETKIQDLTSSSPKSTGEVKFGNLAQKMSYKVDADMVSSILKETSVLELQKQVLTYMMENEILKNKIDQIGQLLMGKEIEQEYIEKLFQDEVHDLADENKQLLRNHEEQTTNNAALVSRVRMLERIIQSMSAENQDLIAQISESAHTREPLQTSGGFSSRQVISSTTSPSFCSSRRFSLPAQHVNEPNINVNCAKSKLLSNASSFIDVTIEDSDMSDSDFTLPLKTLSFHQRKSSTPLTTDKREGGKKLSGFLSSSLLPKNHASKMSDIGSKPGKRLTFNSMKTLANTSSLGSSSREGFQKRPLHYHRLNGCDNSTSETRNAAPVPLLESIKEKGSDSFYAVLEKLKAESNVAMAKHNLLLESERQETRAGDRCPSSGKSDNPSPSRKYCLNTPDSPPRLENMNAQTKDKKGASKNIHRRIQNILDRITSESDSASAV